MSARSIRIPLIGLDLFVGVTAIVGAVMVVPSLPASWLSMFPDYTIPSLALGITAGLALVAAAAVALRPLSGAELSVLAGIAMVVYEVVEAIAVGNLVTPPPVENAQGNVALWLQVVYAAIGLTMIWLGLTLWTRVQPRDSWPQRLRHALR